MAIDFALQAFIDSALAAGQKRIEIYNPATAELRRPDAGWAKEFEPLGDHRYRIAKSPGYR